jgi:uncharacterized protein (DUF58 family)
MLSLAAKKAFRGTIKGEKRSTKRGTSVEFADFRAYSPGDDFRRVDWNVYGRLEKLFLKLFMEEEDLEIQLLVDCSTSMSFGEPKKIDFARRLAAALGYIGLTNLDRVGMALFSDRLRSVFPSVRGRPYIFQMFDFLSNVACDGETNLNTCFRNFAQRAPRAGVAVVLSDFLVKDGYEVGLKGLMSRGFEINVIHVLDRTEVEPSVVGDLKLVDAETGDTKEVTISASAIRAYRDAVESYCAQLRQFCLTYGMTYIRTTTDTPFEDLVLKSLRAAGVVK